MDEQEYYELCGLPPRGTTWIATDGVGRDIEFIADQFHEYPSLEDAKSAEDVRAYARPVEKSQPSFAQDLYAAANLSEEK